jgi:hypothetical protein
MTNEKRIERHRKEIAAKVEAAKKEIKRLYELAKKDKSIVEYSQLLSKSDMPRQVFIAHLKDTPEIGETWDKLSDLFQGRLVGEGMKRTPNSDSFVKFVLSSKHGWQDSTKVKLDADLNVGLSFRDAIMGMEEGGIDEDSLNGLSQ